VSKSGIEWTEETWNPIVGCSILSPGCIHCYAMGEAARLERINAAARAAGKPAPAPQYDGTTAIVNGRPVWTGKLALAGDNILLRPLKRQKPTTYFVNSMGDLFHEKVPDEWIDRVFAVMALTPQHAFQVLTKRAARMRDYMASRSKPDEHFFQAEEIRVAMTTLAATPSRREMAPALRAIPFGQYCKQIPWALPNVWLGVSAERQQEADERIPLLLQTPAAVRFISAEPMLGPIELWNMDEGALRGCAVIQDGHVTASTPDNPPEGVDTSYPGLDWVIVGGESGPGSRPMHPAWARSLRDQCSAAGVPFFFKQWGTFAPARTSGPPLESDVQKLGDHMVRVGKKAAGRMLDGAFHDAMPRVR